MILLSIIVGGVYLVKLNNPLMGTETTIKNKTKAVYYIELLN